jgi:hypothetical protein
MAGKNSKKKKKGNKNKGKQGTGGSGVGARTSLTSGKRGEAAKAAGLNIGPGSASFASKQVEAERGCQTARGVFNAVGLNETWWVGTLAAPNPGFGDTGDEAPIYSLLSKLAVSSTYGRRLDTTSLQYLADIVPMAAAFLFEAQMDYAKAEICPSLTRSDDDFGTSVANSLLPRTVASMVNIMNVVEHSPIHVPEISIRLARLLSQPIQIGGSIPAQRYPPAYLLPVACKMYSGSEMLELYERIQAQSQAYYIAKELGIPSKILEPSDLVMTSPVPWESQMAQWITDRMPTGITDGGAAFTVSDGHCGKSTTDVYYSSRTGMGSFWDISNIWSTTTSARASNIWESLVPQDPGAASKISLAVAGETSSTPNFQASTATQYDFIRTIAAARSVNYPCQHLPYWIRNDNVFPTELAWNQRAQIWMLKHFGANPLSIQLNSLLPYVTDITAMERSISAQGASPQASAPPDSGSNSNQQTNMAQEQNSQTSEAGGGPQTSSQEQIGYR